MPMRWRVMGVPLAEHNKYSEDTSGEPFWGFKDKTGAIILLTKEEYFSEEGEAKSSAHEENQQLERERG